MVLVTVVKIMKEEIFLLRMIENKRKKIIQYDNLMKTILEGMIEWNAQVKTDGSTLKKLRKCNGCFVSMVFYVYML